MEALDRNKSALTHVATATAAAWLDNLGCKPVETEVSVAGGWTADVASFWSPTMTEAKNSGLLKALLPPDVRRDSHEGMAALSRRFGGRLTVVIEIKVSRADFLRDVGRKYGVWGPGISADKRRATIDPPAHLCVLACPPGVKRDDEHLTDWAHLDLSAECNTVRKFHRDWHGNPQHPSQIEDLIAAVAMRRDNHTRYASIRRWLKSYRAGKA